MWERAYLHFLLFESSGSSSTPSKSSLRNEINILEMKRAPIAKHVS